MAEQKIESTPWTFTNGVVTKQCKYSGLMGDATTYQLDIAIPSVRSGYTGLLEPKFEMTLRPNLLADLHVPEPIRGKLEVPGSALDFPEVPIDIKHIGDKAAIMATTSVLDAETFVELISSGQGLQFVLISHNTPVLTLPIPNEPEVIKIFQEALD